MIDAHYSKVRNIPIASTYYEKLRSTFDQIERHIRSLEALWQNVENECMVSLLRSKLPRTILAKLEDIKTRTTFGLWQILEKNWRNTCQLKNLETDWLNWMEAKVTSKRNKEKLPANKLRNNDVFFRHFLVSNKRN